MAEEYKQLSYRDLGFDEYGLNRVNINEQIPSNLADYLLELSEYSVSNSNVKNVSADKLIAGTLAAVTNLGDESIVLDGDEKEIVIYDNLGNPSIYMKGGSA